MGRDSAEKVGSMNACAEKAPRFPINNRQGKESTSKLDDVERHKRYRLDLAYDGTNFSGWALQPNLRTVQGVLEDALALVLPRLENIEYTPRLTVAGRTDAGVHALGQVAHLDVPESLVVKGFSREETDFAATLRRKMSKALARDPDVAVHSIQEAPAGFDARFSALSRTYEYKISDGFDTYNPLTRLDRWRVDTAIDLDILNETSQTLLGLRDFGAFCKPREGSTSIRDLQEFSWRRDTEGTLVSRLKADAFCHSMVRNLVGALVEVAKGRLNLARLIELLDAAKRSPEIIVAPAHGLTLLVVEYPQDHELASRAEQTRGLRELE